MSLPERWLSERDARLAHVISSQPERWSSGLVDDPIWGLIRMVLAQQISTKVACQLAERVKCSYPHLTRPSPKAVPGVMSLRTLGLSERRAQCCVTIVERSDEIRSKVSQGQPWEQALADVKGIGPWTIAVFRIMVLRDPDVLPMGDVGLIRAVAKVYGAEADMAQLGELWRPFRSVACWYLWRTLGNEQLG